MNTSTALYCVIAKSCVYDMLRRLGQSTCVWLADARDSWSAFTLCPKPIDAAFLMQPKRASVMTVSVRAAVSVWHSHSMQ